MSWSASVVTPECVRLVVPGLPSCIGLVRLAMTGLASRLALPFDESEDLKLAVTETCSHVLRQARFRVDLHVRFEVTAAHLQIRVEGVPRQPLTAPKVLLPSFALGDLDGDVGIGLVQALLDEVEISSDDQTGATSVTLTQQMIPDRAR
ncbi:MAG: hypothetical protein EB084_05590 [Proteobacteria bacterium]|nr:hypothetical protein [Pseudomonadota bacterium]